MSKQTLWRNKKAAERLKAKGFTSISAFSSPRLLSSPAVALERNLPRWRKYKSWIWWKEMRVALGVKMKHLRTMKL
jgi:hypothetical protein